MALHSQPRGLDLISLCTGGGNRRNQQMTFLPRRAHDLSGQIFGKLTVLRPNGVNKSRSMLWVCACACGGQITTASERLKRGSTTSCGCRRSEASIETITRNGGPHNRGLTYTIRGQDEVFSSIVGWREAAIREKGNSCEICGWAEASCDVHHRVPISRGGQNTLLNSIVLCPNHHRIAHEGVK